jgi:hypothetical protein
LARGRRNRYRPAAGHAPMNPHWSPCRRPTAAG